jgi:isoquinoline 1-oxidoreductase subunit beta
MNPHQRARVMAALGRDLRLQAFPTLRRRTFLKIAAGAAGGMVVATRMPGLTRAAAKPAPPAPDLFVQIDPDNKVTLTIPKSEMGQGVRTSLALLIAEELDADWSQVHVETAPFDPRYGDQGTGGSGSVWQQFEPLREVGAAMRTMLVAAAAARWKVPASRLRTENGHVLHAASSRKASFGELAADAARQRRPARAALRPRSQWKLIGKEHVGLDVPDIVHGRARFGLDQRPAGMLFASIERPREFGARVETVDSKDALAVPGVRKVVSIESTGKDLIAGGVAVIATSTWAALEARRRLRIRWKSGPHAAESSASYARDMAAALDKAGAEEVHKVGDPDGQLARASKVLRADYGVPFLAHATLEPMNCTAHWDGKRMTLWAPTQFPDWMAGAVAGKLGLKPDQVVVNVTLLGGGFGRRIQPDYGVEAAAVARQIDAPVQVMWTREDDLGHDFYRPCARHRLEACLDERGFPLALRHRFCDPAIGVTYGDSGEQGKSEGDGVSDAFYRVPHRKSEFTLLPSGVPRGWWRAVNTTHTTFAIESFIDELAEAAGKDPLEYRLALIEAKPVLGKRPPDPDTAFRPERMKDCLKLAAERAGWGGQVPAGRGRGIACCFDHSSYSAMVIEVSVERGRAIIHRVVCAADCGTVVHPNGARAQIEGSIVHGLSAALRERITIDRGGVVETNFDRYRLLRFDEAPAAIEVHFIDRPDVRVTGLGEPGLPPVAPALATAIYRATGRRLRELPLDLG